MGTIVDRSWEHLAPSDMMIARVRRLLLRAARGLAADGTLPPGALNPLSLDGVRGGHFVAPKEVEWLKAYADRRSATPAKILPAEAAE